MQDWPGELRLDRPASSAGSRSRQHRPNTIDSMALKSTRDKRGDSRRGSRRESRAFTSARQQRTPHSTGRFRRARFVLDSSHAEGSSRARAASAETWFARIWSARTYHKRPSSVAKLDRSSPLASEASRGGDGVPRSASHRERSEARTRASTSENDRGVRWRFARPLLLGERGKLPSLTRSTSREPHRENASSSAGPTRGSAGATS